MPFSMARAPLAEAGSIPRTGIPFAFKILEADSRRCSDFHNKTCFIERETPL